MELSKKDMENYSLYQLGEIRRELRCTLCESQKTKSMMIDEIIYLQGEIKKERLIKTT